MAPTLCLLWEDQFFVSNFISIYDAGKQITKEGCAPHIYRERKWLDWFLSRWPYTTFFQHRPKQAEISENGQNSHSCSKTVRHHQPVQPKTQRSSKKEVDADPKTSGQWRRTRPTSTLPSSHRTLLKFSARRGTAISPASVEFVSKQVPRQFCHMVSLATLARGNMSGTWRRGRSETVLPGSSRGG